MLKYLQLTKPSIMLLVIITGAASLAVQGSLTHHPLASLLILLGLGLTGGSANAFNMYFERDIDAQMSRTRNRRPLPKGELKPVFALAFAIAIGIFGIAIFIAFFNILSAVMALATIIYYALFYTLVLKPHTVHNIVIGGAAGAMGPVIAWAASSGSLAIQPILLFLIIFLWSPPHFWALAIYLKKDYELVKYPMLPVVKGEKSTKNQIVAYTILLILSSGFLVSLGGGVIYLAAVLIGGGILFSKAMVLKKSAAGQAARKYFGISIIYLFALFMSLIADNLLKITF